MNDNSNLSFRILLGIIEEIFQYTEDFCSQFKSEGGDKDFSISRKDDYTKKGVDISATPEYRGRGHYSENSKKGMAIGGVHPDRGQGTPLGSMTWGGTFRFLIVLKISSQVDWGRRKENPGIEGVVP